MLIYYYAVFPQYGGEPVSALEVGVLGALFYASELIGSPIFGVLSDRVGHRRVMLVGPGVRRRRRRDHGVHGEPAGHRVHAPPRGRVDRRLRPVDPRVHRVRHRRRRAPAGQGRRQVRGGDPRRADGRLRRRRRPVRRPRAAGVPAQRARLPGVLPDLPLRGPAARRAGARGALPRPIPEGLRRYARGSSPAATCGCWHPRGSPSTRRSACSPARRCSSWSGSGTPSSRTRR